MKAVLKNYAYSMVYQVLLMILPVVTTPYVSRVLLPSGVGKYNYAYSIVSVFLVFVQLGTNTYGQREIAFVQENKHERSEVFWNIWLIRLIATIVVLPFYILLARYLKEYTSLLLYMIVYLLSVVIDCTWYFMGMELFKKTAMKNIASKLLGVIMVFVFVKNSNDIIKYSIIIGLSQLIGNIMLLPSLYNSIEPINNISFIISKHIRPIFELFFPTVAVYVYTYIDKIILGAIKGDVEVGLYSQPERIIKLLMTIVTSFGIVLLPHVASSIQKKDMEEIRSEIEDSTRIVGLFGIPLVIGCVVLANRFIPWFLGEGFTPSISLFMIMSPLIIIIGLASIVGQAVLIPLKKEKIYTFSILSGAMINLILNLILIPRYSSFGAALGTLAAEIVVTTIQYITVVKSIGMKSLSIIKNNSNYVLIGILVGFLGYVMNKSFPSKFYYLFLIVLACSLFYIVSLLIVKDKIVLMFLRRTNKGE